MMNVKQYIEEHPELYGKYSGSRIVQVKWARFYLFYYMRYNQKMRVQHIADMFGLDTHATVLNGIKKYELCYMYRDVNYFTKDVRDNFPMLNDIKSYDLPYPVIPDGDDWVDSNYISDYMGVTNSQARRTALKLGIERINRYTKEKDDVKPGVAILYNKKQLYERYGIYRPEKG